MWQSRDAVLWCKNLTQRTELQNKERNVLDKLRVTQVVKKFHAFNDTRKFIT